MKSYLKKFGKIACLALLLMVVLPSVSFAAADVFDTIQAKMISTVKDVRKIVYIIAGFGLVMFSVLAIFNKISFKHLSYIMISLTILALMMPFIEYFSGQTMVDNELNYDNYLRNDDASITGSDASQQSGCAPGACPEDIGGDDNNQNNNPNSQGENPEDNLPQGATGEGQGAGGEGQSGSGGEGQGGSGDGTGVGAGSGDNGDDADNGDDGDDEDYDDEEDYGDDAGNASSTPSSASTDANGDGVTTAAEQKKSLKDRSRNALNQGKNFIDNVHNAIDMVQKGVGAAQGVAGGIAAVGNVVRGDGTVLDKIVGVGVAVDGAATNVGSNLSGALTEGSVIADYLGAEGLSDFLSGQKDGVSNTVGNVSDWGNMSRDLGALINNARNVRNRVRR